MIMGKLSNLKESHPLQVDKYAIAQGIQHESSFIGWVYHVLKKKDRIISMEKQLSAWYQKRTHKFGFKLHKMVQQAYTIDEMSRSTLWQDTMQKEMEIVNLAFQIMPKGEKPLNGV